MPDVTVIGAGPAGSVAALLLARRGWRVALIEQHRFPRDKVCGECLSALGIEVLERIGLAPALQRLHPVPLRRTLLHTSRGQSADVPLPREMVGISRHALDGVLLEEAKKAGASVMVPVRCEGLICDSGDPARVSVRFRHLESNELKTLSASFVLLADGKSALLGVPPAPTGDFGIKSHWRKVNSPRDAIELFGLQGCYGGLAAIEADRWNAAFSVPAARLREHRGNVESLFCEVLAENPRLRYRLAQAEQVGPWLASPLPRFGVRQRWPARVIPLGNAAAAVEPIGGEGMGLALRSAELAANALDAAHGSWSARAQRRLQCEYRRIWSTRRLGCRAGALIAASPRTSSAVLRLLRESAALSKAVFSVAGK